jgi:hypothetical protein
MRIAARLALNAPVNYGLLDDYVRGPAKHQLLAYHGCDVIVRKISETGFSADIAAEIAPGAVVKLKLPVAGVLVARVTRVEDGRVEADFVNPVSAARLRSTLGMSRTLAA